MIGKAMEKWEDAALRRVFDAPLEHWNPLGYGTAVHPRVVCLVMHVAGLTCDNPNWVYLVDNYFAAFGQDEEKLGQRYDSLVARVGLPRAVRALKQRALAILLRRHPLDSRLRAETVEA